MKKEKSTLEIFQDTKQLLGWMSNENEELNQEMSKLYFEYTKVQLPSYNLIPEEQKHLYWKFVREQFKQFINTNSPI